MRLIRGLLPDDRLEAVTDALDDEGIDYVRQRTWIDGDERWMVEFPVPIDAIGHVLERLEDEGIDVDRYSTITSLESAMTPGIESL